MEKTPEFKRQVTVISALVVHARLASGARLDARETWREGDEGIAVVPKAAAFAADEPVD